MIIITPKKKETSSGYRTVGISMRWEMYDRIEELSRASGRSRNEIIIMLLTEAVERVKIVDSDE